MSVNNVYINADIGGLLGSMFMSSLNESCVSCFVQWISPSAVSLLNMSVCCWLGAAIHLLLCVSLSVCVRFEWVCVLTLACMSEHLFLLCWTLCFYCNYSGRKWWQYSVFYWGKNVNVSLVSSVHSFYGSNQMYVENLVAYIIVKGLPAIWWLSCMFRGP